MDKLPAIAQFVGLIVNCVTILVLLIKPIREKIFGIGVMRDGQRCVLRSEMLRIYYEAKDNEHTIRQYEYENFCLLYAAYKAMKGNSFIDKIYNEVAKMEVVT